MKSTDGAPAEHTGLLPALLANVDTLTVAHVCIVSVLVRTGVLGVRRSGGSARRDPMSQPSSVMWMPVRQQLDELARSIPSRLRTSLLKTSACLAAVWPFTLLIAIALPPLLLGDHLLQRVYKAHSELIDSVVTDLLEIFQLFWDATRISLKHTLRLVRRVVKKATSDPLWLLRVLFRCLVFVITNPIKVAVRVARALWRVGEGVVRGAVLVKKTVTQAGKKEEDDDLDKW